MVFILYPNLVKKNDNKKKEVLVSFLSVYTLTIKSCLNLMKTYIQSIYTDVCIKYYIISFCSVSNEYDAFLLRYNF